MAGVLRILTTVNQWVGTAARVRAGEQVSPMELIDLGLQTLFAEDTARDVKRQGQDLLSTIMFGSAGAEFDAPSYDGVPWAGFARHIKALPWGVICIYGDPGQGKTQFAIKQASGWRERPGWTIEGSGMYPEDRPPWIETVSMSRLIARMRKIGRYLDQEEEVGTDDGLTADDLRRKKTPAADAKAPHRITPGEIARMGRRVVIVDEAGLFFSSLGASGQSETRDVAKRFSDQIRHLDSIFVFIAQKISDIPAHVRASSLNIFKVASKGVVQSDFRPGSKRDTSEKWIEALMALAAVKTGSFVEPLPNFMDENQREAVHRAALAHSYWVGPLADIRAWGYAMGPLGNQYVRTVFPFTPFVEPGLLTVGEAGD